jgi:glycosyltransferase involved in cell wall biosynthesis
MQIKYRLLSIYQKLGFESLFVYFFSKYLIRKYRVINNERPPRLLWGIDPIINNHYWSKSMRELFFDSDTVMRNYLPVINNKDDFDYYLNEILDEIKVPRIIKFFIGNWLLLESCLKKYDIFHISYNGGILGNSKYWKNELEIIKKCGKKIVAIPFGGDAFIFSKMKSPSQQHAFLINFSRMIQKEEEIEQKVRYLGKYADFCVGGGQIDGMSRWDSLAVNCIGIDTRKWIKKKLDLEDKVIKVAHSPNHRGVKGTEYLIEAIESLKQEGLKVELLLIENKKNDEVKRILFEEADILVEQLIMNGHGLSAIEGMATGLPVISNIEDDNFQSLFNRYSYLSECPIVSGSPENIKENLKTLILNPLLRNELGSAGRKYVEKYHSYNTTKEFFKSVYDIIWNGKDADMINYYHPLMKESYNNRFEKVEHPLIRNKISEKKNI